jgi:hypothetical protein
MEEAIESFKLLDRKLDSLQRIGLVKGYTRTNQLLVPLSVQRQRIEAWHRFWTSERLATVRRLIGETAPLAGLRPEAFASFFDAATADYQPDPLYKAGIVPEGYLSMLTEQSYGGDYLVFTAVRCANDSVRSSDSDYMRICDAIASDPHLLVLDTYYYTNTTDTLLKMSRDFDTGLHYIGGLGEGEPLHDIFRRLGLLRLPWQRLDPDGFDRITIGDRTFRLAEGFDCFADALADEFPRQRQERAEDHHHHAREEATPALHLVRARRRRQDLGHPSAAHERTRRRLHRVQDEVTTIDGYLKKLGQIVGCLQKKTYFCKV